MAILVIVDLYARLISFDDHIGDIFHAYGPDRINDRVIADVATIKECLHHEYGDDITDEQFREYQKRMSDYAATTNVGSLDRWVMLMANVMRGTEYTHYRAECDAARV